MTDIKESDFVIQDFKIGSFGLIVNCPSEEHAVSIKNKILWNQGFTKDILTNYIKFLEEEQTSTEKTRDIEQVIADIQMIESGDFFGEE